MARPITEISEWGKQQRLPSMAALSGLNPRRQPLLPWLSEALSILAPLGRSYWLSSKNNSAQNCYVFLCGLTGVPVMRENTSSKSRQLNSKVLHQMISLQYTVTHQLTRGVGSEGRSVRWLCRANITKLAYTHLHGPAHCTPGPYGPA